MKTVEILGQRQVVLVDRPDLKPAKDFVIVKILVAPMCTEYKAFRDGHA